VKWEPIAAMLALLVLGVWLVLGTDRAGMHGIMLTTGSTTQEIRIGNERGVLEVLPRPLDGGDPSFRVLLRNGHQSPVLTADDFRELYGNEALEHATADRSNVVFRLLNITSWAGVAWVTIGFVGQIAFFGRMLVQWLVSEKQRQSVIPEVFWWLSLVGGVMLFVYFVWRQDIVGVLGQTSGVVIYGRNIRLIHKHKRREARRLAAQGQPSA
jgi:lipid-A-disaccharide synthase-like uncharacterized protein